MRHDDREINSVGDLLDALRQQAVNGELVWFRGHASSAWHLVPNLARNAQHLARETELIKRFIQLAVPHLTDNPPRSDWEWIFLMQHQGVPTRLLDWTESPLTALWFAVSSRNPATEAQDGALWCLSPLALNREARFRGRLENELPGFGSDDNILDAYLPDRRGQGVGQNPVAATGPRTSRRMAAQLGNFTISDWEATRIETVGAAQHVWRLNIPAASKPRLRDELRFLRFNELTLFPDLDRVASVTMELLS